MKTINGVPYKRIKTAMGRKYLVQMTEAELTEHYLYLMTIILTPALMIFLFAWAAGMI